jgi:curli production assembly/transport component CsgG
MLSVLLSGCATMASMPPKVSEIAYSAMSEVPPPANGKIVLAVYQFGDLTGQQKPNLVFGEMSKAVTQGSSNLLIKALKDVGNGEWFRVAERESLQSLLQERKLIRTTRQMTQGDKAKPLGPMLYAGAYLTGGIVGYDSNTMSGGIGHRFLGIGASVQYRHDTVTVMLRLINVVSGEVELTVMIEKTIISVSAGGDKFKYLDLDTELLEIEAGIAMNEPVTYAVRKTIEGAVVELVNAGQKKGLWKFKAPEWIDPGKMLKIEVNIPTTEELLEEIVEADDEVRETVKENQSKTYAQHHEEKLAEKEIPKEIFSQKLLDEIQCGVTPHSLECLGRSTKNIGKPAHETSDKDPVTTPTD